MNINVLSKTSEILQNSSIPKNKLHKIENNNVVRQTIIVSRPPIFIFSENMFRIVKSQRSEYSSKQHSNITSISSPSTLYIRAHA